MKRLPEDFVEHFFRFIVVVSGIITTILLITAIIRLLDADPGELPRHP